VNLRDVVRAELRAVGLTAEPFQPLPADLDAEGEILSALLEGDVTHAFLAPLEGGHFYSLIHAAIWNAAKDVAPGDLVAVRAGLVSRGWVGALDQELLQLADRQPWRSRERLREQAERVIELAKRRKLIRALQRIEADLRTDRLSVVDAGERLREVLA
jgi:replicative DNA helicase